MRALGAQGLQIVRRAAETIAAVEPTEQAAECVVLAETPESNKPTRRARKPPQKSSRKPTPSLPVFDRDALRARLEAASVRPMPGTSELLKRGLHTEYAFGYTEGGKLTNDAESHDLTALAPIHLKRKE